MVIHQGCPQTPGGRIRALGFASTRTRGRRRGPIPALCQYQGSPVSYPRALMVILKAALKRRASASTPLASRPRGRRAAVAARYRHCVSVMARWYSSPSARRYYTAARRADGFAAQCSIHCAVIFSWTAFCPNRSRRLPKSTTSKG